MKLVRIAFQLLLCVSSSRLSYATKRDDNIITVSSTATTPDSIRKTAALTTLVPYPGENCVQGNLNYVKNWCANHNCCQGDNACAGWGNSATVTICADSCHGRNACEEWRGEGEYIVHSGSCKGIQACAYLGMDTAVGASVSVGSGSCIGNEAICYSIAEKSSSPELVVNIEDNTCLGNRACQFAGRDSTVLESVTIYEDSCHGDNSCFEIDRYTKDLTFLQILQRDDNIPITTNLDPSLPITAKPTASPTAAAEKAKNAYQIKLIEESIDVAFNNSRLDNEIMMNLNITSENIMDLSDPIRVFDYDTCKNIEYGSVMLAASAKTNATLPDASTNNVYSSVPIEVNLNTTDIVSYNNSATYPGFFNATDESVVLQFCLKPTLGSSEVVRNGTVETSYISYTKIMVKVKLNMAMDFNTATVTIEEDAPTETTKDSSVEYTLEAYECDAATKEKIEIPAVKSQNSFVTICIESTFEDIIVGSIKELTLTQISSGLVSKAIDNSDANSITTVSGAGTNKTIVTTRLVSAFFSDLETDVQSKIEIAGIAVLKFGSGERKLVRIGNSGDRALQGNDDGDSLGDFAASVDIKNDNDDGMSAATQAKRFLTTLFSAVIGWALVL